MGPIQKLDKSINPQNILLWYRRWFLWDERPIHTNCLINLCHTAGLLYTFSCHNVDLHQKSSTEYIIVKPELPWTKLNQVPKLLITITSDSDTAGAHKSTTNWWMDSSRKKNSQFRCSGQRNRSYRTELTVKAIDPIACLPGKEAVMQRHGQLWGRVLHRRML